MANCTIKCPKCGQEAFCVPENENEANLTYICDKCKNEYTVTFFDYCPNCNRNVGFLEGNSFRNDMISVGKDLVKTVFKPLSAIDSFGGYFVDVFSNNVTDANGDGFCPICHKRFLRCSKCSDLVLIKANAVYKDSFECMCGTVLVSCGANKPKKHSKRFVGSIPQNTNSSKNFNITKQDNSTIYLTRTYTRTELLKIIHSCCENNQLRWNEQDKINKKAKVNLKRNHQIDLTESQFKSVNTYAELADLILDNGIVKEDY